jgi:hypothetical protein
MVTTSARETQHDVSGFRFDAPTTEPHVWTITARLLAARRELDGRITLAVADPDGRPHRMLLAFPSPHDPLAAHPVHGPSIAQSRAAFVEEFVNPSEEGFDLLYGTARLTLALAEDALRSGRCLPRIVNFTPLGD